MDHVNSNFILYDDLNGYGEFEGKRVLEIEKADFFSPKLLDLTKKPVFDASGRFEGKILDKRLRPIYFVDKLVLESKAGKFIAHNVTINSISGKSEKIKGEFEIGE